MVKSLRWVAYITIGVAFIGGIIAGNILAPEPEYSFEDKGFAWGYMLMFWAVGGISGIFTLAFASLLEYVESLSLKINSIESSLISVKSSLITTDSTKLISNTPQQQQKTCPNCYRFWTQPDETKEGNQGHCRVCQEQYENRMLHYK